MERQLLRSELDRQVGSALEVLDDVASGYDLSLDVVSVTPIPAGQAGADDGFTVAFRGPDSPRLAQGTWRLRSDEHELAIFLVPHGPMADGGMAYGAVFN